MLNSLRRMPLVCGAIILALSGSGCGKSPPAITEVEGVVLLNKKPLPSAMIEFQPEIEVGPEYVSTAITDKDGKFKLMLEQKQTAGAAVCKHRVVVRNGPPPEGGRGMSENAQNEMTKFMNGLANRPIPREYNAAGSTPLRVEVTTGQKEYTIELTR